MTNDPKLKQELLLYRILLLMLVGLIAFLGYCLYDQQHKKEQQNLSPEVLLPRTASQDLPYYDKVMDILSPLEYSGIMDMMKPDVDLKIDFKNKNWTLTNIHEFDNEGFILLDHDRYGLCGELAAYVYKRIVPFMSDRFDIFLLKVSESGFFLRPHSTHIILVLFDKTTHERFFIDPSFRRYGKEEDFNDYQFFEGANIKTHLASLQRDVTLGADVEAPLLIRKNFLLCLSIESSDNNFDENNFAIAITANKRHEYSGRYVFALRKQNGKKLHFKNELLLSELLTNEEAEKIFSKVTEWFQKIDLKSA